MDVSLAEVKAACPSVDERLANEHLSRMDERYFRRFSVQEICEHLSALGDLSSSRPAEVICVATGEAEAECTVCALDNPFVFSLITGVLSSSGFNILSGDVFTWGAVRSERPPVVPRGRRRPGLRKPDPLARRRIVDYFAGRLPRGTDPAAWSAFVRGRLAEVLGLLEEKGLPAQVEARQRVNHMVAESLRKATARRERVLYPMHLETDLSASACTRLTVVSQDTPFFLYSLSTALSLQGLLIDRVEIRTEGESIRDTIDITDRRGGKVEHEETINQIKLSVLLTKQFTYFLGEAPDPYAAIVRFEQMVSDIVELPQSQSLTSMLSDPKTLKQLAVLLGTSDYLWEDFVRLQYESIIPMLGAADSKNRFSQPARNLPARLDAALAEASCPEERTAKLNEFKDHEIFQIDLDHILGRDVDFDTLAGRLTVLAEAVVSQAASLVWHDLVSRYGIPRTVGGLPATYALLGLGKLGGAALGYASDIELLVVYSDNGATTGKNSISNAEFFDRLVKGILATIKTKRDGIFAIDMRLRPFGADGPLACSMESFCRYYGKGGPAHSYERLALVRLRAFGGDAALGEQIQRLRDEYIYTTHSINPQQIRELRRRQFQEKVPAGALNVKFGQGGLVDLEYDVQLLQVIHGREHEELRTPRTRDALDALSSVGVLDRQECAQLSTAYGFLRRLINALRMLRGSARDLFLPPIDSREFGHLARRMGYVEQEGASAVQQLRVAYDTHTARVRAFVEHHFGRDSLPGPRGGNVADIVLSESIPREVAVDILTQAGFVNPSRALVNLRDMARDEHARGLLSRLVVLAVDKLRRTPDPDMALNNWERFVRTAGDPAAHYGELLSQPMRLEILLAIFAGSQFLADTLINNPDFFDWATHPRNLHQTGRREDLEAQLRARLNATAGHEQWLAALRRFRRRELLRIGTRDICLKVSMTEVMSDLSALAEASVAVALDAVWDRLLAAGTIHLPDGGDPRNRFCLMAFGKLGGRELNYSSDIDLLGVHEIPPGHDSDIELSRLGESFHLAVEKVCEDLSRRTEEGHVFRVDMRVRPYGRSGNLSHSTAGLLDYYRHKARQWERQALLKLRPIAGTTALGESFLHTAHELLCRPADPEAVTGSVRRMRESAVRMLARRYPKRTDVKDGRGGIRDIEFCIQALQLVHIHKHRELLTGNTLEAIERLEALEILPEADASLLRDRYLFLRRIEHYLQLLDDRQIHLLPAGEAQLTALGKRVMGAEYDLGPFGEKLGRCLDEVHGVYEKYVTG